MEFGPFSPSFSSVHFKSHPIWDIHPPSTLQPSSPLTCSKFSLFRWEIAALNRSSGPPQLGKGLVLAARRALFCGCLWGGTVWSGHSLPGTRRRREKRRNCPQWRLPSLRLPAPSCCPHNYQGSSQHLPVTCPPLLPLCQFQGVSLLHPPSLSLLKQFCKELLTAHVNGVSVQRI